MGACLKARDIYASSPLHEKGTGEHLGYGQPDRRKGSLCRPSLLWASWCAALHTYCCALCAAWDPDLHNRWCDPVQAEDSAFGGPITFAKQLSRYAQVSGSHKQLATQLTVQLYLKDQETPLHRCTPTLLQCMTPSQRQSLCVLRLPVPERPPALLHLPLSLPAVHHPCAVDKHAFQQDEHTKICRSSLPSKG